MSAARFTLRLATGEVVGPVAVHGAGGPLSVNAEHLLRVSIRRASEGRPMRHVVEPRPGHVRTYTHEAAGDRDERAVDVRGAAILSVD